MARADLPRGEKVLAHTVANDGTWLLGTRLHLVLVEGPDSDVKRAIQIPWETVEDAAWDQEASRLRVTEIGQYGEPRPGVLLRRGGSRPPAAADPRASDREHRAPAVGARARQAGSHGHRAPQPGRRPVAWMHAYDEGVDPTDPEVVAVADQALAQAQVEVGEPADGSVLGRLALDLARTRCLARVCGRDPL